MELAYSLGNQSPRIGGGVPLPDHLAAVAAAGFHFIEMDDWTFDAPPLEADPLRLAAALAASALACAAFGPLRITDSVSTLAALEHIEVALGAVSPPFVPVVVQRRRSDSVELLRTCIDRVAAAGARLALEFFAWSAVPTMSDASSLLDAVADPRLCLLVDSFHVGCGAASLAQLASLDPARLGYVQLADVKLPLPLDLQAASSHRRVLPGAGDLELDAFMTTLEAIGFDGIVSIEVLSDDLRHRDPAEVALAARQRAVDLIDHAEASRPGPPK
jgi:sugar phosphate isomerase/epimerase